MIGVNVRLPVQVTLCCMFSIIIMMSNYYSVSCPKCVFPFYHKGKWHHECIKDEEVTGGDWKVCAVTGAEDWDEEDWDAEDWDYGFCVEGC